MAAKGKKNMSIDDIISSKSTDKLQVFIMSWNMGNAEPEGLQYVFSEKNATNQYDILVLGLQESTYAYNNGDCITHLGGVIESIVGANYFKVKHAYRVQMQLYVFAKKSLQGRITNVQYSVENTGFLHVFPNKGGILVTMQVDGTKLAFISCHLAAHEGIKHCEERNASIAEILGGVRAGDERFDVSEQFHHLFWMGDMNYRTTFDTTNLPANTKKNIKELNAVAQKKEEEMARSSGKSGVKAGTSDTTGTTKSGKSTDNSDSESDGDEGLLKSTKDGKEVSDKELKKREWKQQHKKTMDMVVNERWADILALDELNREIAAGRVMNNFTALQPSFPPTFKRTRNVSILPSHQGVKSAKNWDLQADEDGADPSKVVSKFYHHKRIPSFTDRILYKSMPTFSANVKNMFFESCENAVSSDHKPVRAAFEVKISKGEQGIVVDKQLLRWKGKVSKKTSGSRTDVNVLRMTLSDLRGENLEEMDAAMFGGGSDPYIIVTTDPASVLLYKGTFTRSQEGIKSKVIKHNLNPVWKDPMELALASIDLKGLARNASLLISVWDEDLTNADDLIGVMTIPIKEILRAHSQNKAYVFTQAPLHSNTEIMGTLSGKIQVQGSYKDLLAAFEKLETEKTSTDKYITLEQALMEHAAADNSACACTMS